MFNFFCSPLSTSAGYSSGPPRKDVPHRGNYNLLLVGRIQSRGPLWQRIEGESTPHAVPQEVKYECLEVLMKQVSCTPTNDTRQALVGWECSLHWPT